MSRTKLAEHGRRQTAASRHDEQRHAVAELGIVRRLPEAMKLACFLVILAVTACGYAAEGEDPTSKAPDPALERYFVRYCDYTGNMGIGFVASHTYTFKFRQRLKTTQDEELKRLFVLQHLYGELDLAISDFEKGIIMTGQADSRKMTRDERVSTLSSINESLDDLSRFDPGDPESGIAEFRKRLKRASTPAPVVAPRKRHR